MNAPLTQPLVFHPDRGGGKLAMRLREALKGDVMFDAASRGRYATDASIYQVDPLGVVVPRTMDDVRIALDVCRQEKVPVLPRGAGSSQCGQTVGAALIIDHSKYLNRVLAFDADALTVSVEPGVVLDQLNAWLRPKGVWFPVDVSTSAQATIGGMAGNNSCGSRSILYGNMVHNVHAIEATLADGTEARFGPEREMKGAPERVRSLLHQVRATAGREHDEIASRVPKVLRRVGGYNIDVFHPQSERPYTADGSVNTSHLLVGSEGTLAWSRAITLKVSPLPRHRALGVVNFPTLCRAMECAQHLVRLGPSAVELVDRTMIELARSNPAFRPVIDAALIGEPEAILLVEFTSDEHNDAVTSLDHLRELMGDLDLPGSVVAMPDAAAQKALWDVRKAGLNIMMSMKGDGKPVSFIEDCAVPLEHLAEYVDRLTQVFHKHGTRGTWYAHASVGTLHVRPILDMRRDGAVKMRAIAEEAAAMVRQYKGAFSGEHGDGLVRSEWVAWQFGPRLSQAFGEIKDAFDPTGMMNPGKIVRSTRMDDATLFRFAPGYRTLPIKTALDWSAWDVQAGDIMSLPPGLPKEGSLPLGGTARSAKGAHMSPPPGRPEEGSLPLGGTARSAKGAHMSPPPGRPKEGSLPLGGTARSAKGAHHTSAPVTGADPAHGFAKAVEMCNNNGHCRKFDAGTMCPSYRATRDEEHLTRGRANTLRLAVSGQLGPDFASEPVWQALDLCVSCKGCRRECPTGVDMAKMKIEFLHHWHQKHGLSLKDKLIAHLPRWAPWASLLPWLPNLRDTLPGAAWVSERWLGFAAQRTLPMWRRDTFLRSSPATNAIPARAAEANADVVLLVDTFTNYYEPENAHAALDVLHAAGYRVHVARAVVDDDSRPLCCGRTYLAAGLVDHAKAEARRMIAALLPHVERGAAVVGLEPSCLFSLRDEFLVMGLGEAAQRIASRAFMIEEFLAAEHRAGRLHLSLQALPQTRALVHGHCHQKAFDAMSAVQQVLELIPGIKVEVVESSCCGMAGSFGFDARHFDVSMRMAELSLLPAVRAAGADTVIVADGTSCRHQITDGTRAHRTKPDGAPLDATHSAMHVVRVLQRALATAGRDHNTERAHEVGLS